MGRSDDCKNGIEAYGKRAGAGRVRVRRAGDGAVTGYGGR